MAESELTTVARPYARAAFSQALSSEALGAWSSMLGQLATTVQNESVEAALDNPKLTTEAKADLLLGIMADELSQPAQNFVSVLAENGRISLLPTIAEMFELLKANHEKTVNVEVISAFEVETADQETLSKALSEKLQREVSLTATVDASLIGGVIIRAEDTVIDSSVRGKLNKLSQAMG